MARLLEEKLDLPYYSLDDAGTALAEMQKTQFPQGHDGAQVIALPATKIPVVGTTTAGAAIEIIDLYQPGVAAEWVDAYGKPAMGTFALRLEGFSMEDKFHSGDIVQIEPSLEWASGDFVFAKRLSDQHGTFKQIKIEDDRCYLFALNPSFTPRYIEVTEDWSIVGKATWKLQKL